MSTPKKTHGLGRGLGNLIAGGAARISSRNAAAAPAAPALAAPAAVTPAAVTPSVPAASPFLEIPVSKIVPARWQARRDFDETALAELAESIQSEGLLQPVVVRKTADGYELIAGERRWRAFQKLGLKLIPARVVSASDAASAVMTLIENVQRADLNPVDEALGFASLMRDFDLKQEEVAERVGKPRATIANSVRLLTLDREIQGFLAKGMLSAGHAKAILSLDDPASRLQVARRVVETGASVRETEALVKNARGHAAPFPPAADAGSADMDTRKAAAITAEIAAIERRLVSQFNTKVSVRHGRHSGKIVIEYYGDDDLRRILERIGMKA